ncbi:MAG: hypothetical protein HUJ71_06560 [Pseudobutyrivibrio sp.]|nr:hypothetical protein [Pseudobutyrivibrio sp.]
MTESICEGKRDRMKHSKSLVKYRIGAFLLAVILIAAGVIYLPNFAKADDYDNNIPDRIKFGEIDGHDIEWVVLDFDSNTRRALVVTSDILATKSVQEYKNALYQVYPDPTKTGLVNWNNSYWRKWINSTVYNNCFTDNNKKHIHKTTFSVSENQDSLMQYFHAAEGGDPASESGQAMDIDIYYNQVSTKDYLFFLSYEQYVTYKDKIPQASGSYLLKTNSFYDVHRTAAVVGDHVESIYNYTSDGIRPAMWIYLDGLYGDDASSTNSASWSPDAEDIAKVTKRRTYYNNAVSDLSVETDKIVLPTDSVCELRFGQVVPITLELDYLNWSDKKYTATYKSTDTSIFTIDKYGNVVANNDSKVGSATLEVDMMKENGITYTMECKINVGHDLISSDTE